MGGRGLLRRGVLQDTSTLSNGPVITAFGRLHDTVLLHMWCACQGTVAPVAGWLSSTVAHLQLHTAPGTKHAAVSIPQTHATWYAHAKRVPLCCPSKAQAPREWCSVDESPLIQVPCKSCMRRTRRVHTSEILFFEGKMVPLVMPAGVLDNCWVGGGGAAELELSGTDSKIRIRAFLAHLHEQQHYTSVQSKCTSSSRKYRPRRWVTRSEPSLTHQSHGPCCLCNVSKYGVWAMYGEECMELFTICGILAAERSISNFAPFFRCSTICVLLVLAWLALFEDRLRFPNGGCVSFGP